MEDKRLKIPVFATETVFSESAEIPVDIDFTLPDYCADVSKILKCRSISRIASKSTSSRSITVDGCVTVTVIYADRENNICSYEYQYPFNKIFELNSSAEGGVVFARARTEYINCRAVTGRKIDIHGAAGVFVSLLMRKCTELISDVDDINIELLRGSIPATTPMGMCEKYIILEEDIEIGQGQPPIRSVLRYDTATAVKECKRINNRLMVKGELIIKILYCAEDNSVQSISYTEPFSQLLELEGINDSCECQAAASIANIELKPRVSAAGEARSFTLNAKLLLNCECTCNNDIEVVLDAYSRKYNAEITRSQVCFDKIVRNISESFSCKKSIALPQESISAVADMWCDVRSDSVKCEEGQLVIRGTLTASFILLDFEGVPSFFEKAVEFEYSTPCELTAQELKCEPHFAVASSGYTLTGGGTVELRAELCVSAAVYKCSTVSLITDLAIDEGNPAVRQDRGAMTIYFACAGESVWDIGKRYLAGVEDIMQINDLTDEVLEEGRMVLIPIC